MSENLLGLNRDQLAKALGGNYAVIRAFEQIVNDVGGFPSTIEEANALAGSALAIAQTAFEALSVVTEMLSRIEGAPAPVPQVEVDDTTPRAHLGTIAAQNADSVDITGGTIAGVAVTTSMVDSTTIGLATAAAARFTTIAASGQVTSTLATGTPPLVIASTTLVPNLYVAHAQLADLATAANSLTNPSTLPAAATDLPTVITLANALRTAAIAKGL